MQNLVISGCSWSCGEWALSDDDNTLFLKEDWFSKLLTHSFNVFNVSKGGGSNWESIFSLSNFIYFNEKEYKILLFQTDPFRMTLSDRFQVSVDDIKCIVMESENLEAIYQSITEIFYYKVDAISNKIGMPINLVGGLCDVNQSLCEKFSGINVLCESWKKLMDEQYVISHIPTQIDSEMFKFAMESHRFDICDEIETHNLHNFSMYNNLLNNKYIGPVFGDFHPNQDGFSIMSDFIINNKNALK